MEIEVYIENFSDLGIEEPYFTMYADVIPSVGDIIARNDTCYEVTGREFHVDNPMTYSLKTNALPQDSEPNTPRIQEVEVVKDIKYPGKLLIRCLVDGEVFRTSADKEDIFLAGLNTYGTGFENTVEMENFIISKWREDNE